MRAPGSLWRHRDFLLLWGGQSVSEVGSQVTLLALPLLAVTTLHATTLQVAALVDRWRARRVIVWADLLRAVVLATVPLAHLLGVLTLAQPPRAPRAAGRAARRARPRLRTEVREGLVFVLTHPVLRKVVACTATSDFSSSAGAALEVVFLVRVLGASPRVIGAVLALGALGGLAAAALSTRLARRVGSARIIWVSIPAEVPFAFATPLATPGFGVLLVSASLAAGGAAAVVSSVAQVSYRQAVTPPALLGRMNASVRFIVWGVNPLGVLAGGALASVVGVRAVLLLADAGSGLAGLWVLASPLRTARDTADLPGGLGLPAPVERAAPAR